MMYQTLYKQWKLHFLPSIDLRFRDSNTLCSAQSKEVHRYRIIRKESKKEHVLRFQLRAQCYADNVMQSCNLNKPKFIQTF